MDCLEGHCELVEGFTLTFVIIILTIVFVTFLSCVCIKIRDMKLQAYVRKLATSKGVKLELDKMDLKPAQKSSPTQLSENCTIMIPDVAIVL